MPRPGRGLGGAPGVPGVRPRRLLRRLAATPRRRTFRGDAASGHAYHAGGLHLVLRPRGHGNAPSALRRLERSDAAMPPPKRPVIEARREQMFPILESAEIDRLRRFGELRSYRAGEALVKAGEVGHGPIVVL